MKRKIQILSVVIALIFCGCEKKETYHFSIHGKVINSYTGLPVSGAFVGASLQSWVSSCGGYLDSTHSDNYGNFTIEFDYTQRGDFIDKIILSSNSPNTFDSTLSEFKYLSDERPVISAAEANNEQIIKVYPTGQIRMFISDSTWQLIDADSIEIQSPCQTKRIIKNQSDLCVYFHVDASAISIFKWFYYKDGVQSAEISRSIFVPNAISPYWSYYGPFSYEVTF